MLKWIVKLSLGLAVAAGAVAARAEEPPLKIGLAAMISPKETLIYYNGLLGYVGQKLGRKVELIQFRTYDEMDAALEKRDLDIAFVCSGPYVKDKDKFGAELLVAPQSYGKPFYHAYIIAPAGSPATKLADLKGKSFAFTDPKSNTGRIVPTYMVSKDFGAPPERFFSSVKYTYSHDKSIEEVSKGLVAGASVDSLIYDYLAAKSPATTRGTKIVAKSAPYGIPPVIVNPKIDPALRAKVKAAFLAMHEDAKGKAILDGIMVDKFIVPKDKDYDSVREMERWLAKNAPAPVPVAAPATNPAVTPAAAR
jgi:phosphonate transport system substrate-binding protein